MLPKGSGSIRGLHSINTRPGAQTRSEILRRMYLLACEEGHLERKTEWLKRQKEQTQRRLGEIWHALGFLKVGLEKKEKKMSKPENRDANLHAVALKY